MSASKLSHSTLEQQILLTESFAAFFHVAFPLIAPGQELIWEDYIRAICHPLQEMADEQHHKIIINAPPRTLKSSLVSNVYAAWRLGRNPALKVVVVSYNNDLAVRLTRDFRIIIESPLYRRLFPKMQVNQRKNNETEIATTLNGGRLATSFGGSLTGHGGDLLIIDDPMKPGEAASIDTMKRVQEDYRSTLSTRLNTPGKSQVIVVMQRIHEMDLSGYLAEQGGFDTLVLPAVFPETRRINIGMGQHKTYHKGELLCPTRLTQGFLDEQKALMGPSLFEAQYQQNPLPAGGNIFRKDWIMHHDGSIAPENYKERVISWDTASKPGEGNDYTAGTVWGITKDHQYHLIEIIYGQWKFPELKRRVLEATSRYNANFILIEDADHGRALLQELQPSQPKNYIAVKPTLSKEQRAEQATAAFDAGKVRFPEEHSVMPQLTRELLGFPNAKHDDLVDSIVQFLNYMSTRKTRPDREFF